MTCREALRELLMLDADQDPYTELAAHLARCEQCRREEAKLRFAMMALRSPERRRTDDELTGRIMAAVLAEPAPGEPGTERGPMPLRNWLAAGVLILAGILGLQYSDSFEWVRLAFGEAIDLAMGLILGVFLTTYLCLLVGSNLKRVQRLFRPH